jgi:outer membrane protein TolC
MKAALFFSALAMSATLSANAITLDVALQKTLDKNPEIQRAKLNLEQAAGRRLVFHSVALPDAYIGVAGGDQGGHRAGQKSDQPFAFGYGGLMQPLFHAAIPASWRRGNIEVLIAQQQLNVAVVEQLHSARVTFYTALYNRAVQALRAEQQQRLALNASSQQSRYEAGLADRGALVGAEVQTNELQPRVAAAQRGYDFALLKLTAAMGDDLGPDARLPEPEGQLRYTQVDLDLGKGTEVALKHRADLELARLLVRASAEDQRIMEAAYYPAVYAVVSGEYIPVSDVRRNQGEGSPRRGDDIISSEIREGASYTWQVIDNGRVYGAVARQRAAKEINELLLRKMENDVPRDLSRIRNDLDAVAVKYKSLMLASGAAEQNSATLQENMAGGVASQLEFRLAQNDLLEVKTALLGLAYKEKVALAEWDRATGRYLQFSDDNPRKSVQ